MKPGVTDITFSTRTTELADSWSFVMEKLEGHELLDIQITAQDWKQEDDDDFQDTYLTTIQVRVKEKP